MSERLDRVEAILAQMAERQNEMNATLQQTNATLRQTNETLDRVVVQQERNTADIDALLGAVSTTDVEVQKLRESAAETDQRFNILIQEMRSDRQESRTERRAHQQSMQALLLQITAINGNVGELSDRVDGLEQAS